MSLSLYSKLVSIQHFLHLFYISGPLQHDIPINTFDLPQRNQRRRGSLANLGCVPIQSLHVRTQYEVVDVIALRGLFLRIIEMRISNVILFLAKCALLMVFATSHIPQQYLCILLLLLFLPFGNFV